jgi:outer membrane receptor for monomeric catechols
MKIVISKSEWNKMSARNNLNKKKTVTAYENDLDDNVKRKRVIRVEFSDGDHLVTNINGNKKEILDYYFKFNEPRDYDLSHPERTRTVTDVKFLQ